MNERALELCRANAERLGLAQPPRRSASDAVPADLVVDELWSNPPIRIGKAALHELLGIVARPPVALPGGRCSSCRSTSAPTRSTAGSTTKGWSVERAQLAGRLPAARGRVGREAARRHRHEAAPPRVAPTHRRVGRRSCSTTCRDRSTSAPSSAPPPRSGSTTCGWPGTRPTPTTPRWARPRSAPSATSPSSAPTRRIDRHRGGRGGGLPGRRARAGRRRPAAPRARRRSDATCLVVGHEDRGCSPATLDACDEVAFVPLLGKVGSLNVATAASIALYELRRQHWTRPGRSPDNSQARGGGAGLASPPWWNPSYGPCATTSSSTPLASCNRAMLGSVTDEVNEGWAVSDRRRARRSAPSPPTASWSASHATSTPISPCPAAPTSPPAGVTAVGVLSHHRRQGHLTRLMDAQLASHGRARHRRRRSSSRPSGRSTAASGTDRPSTPAGSTSTPARPGSSRSRRARSRW